MLLFGLALPTTALLAGCTPDAVDPLLPTSSPVPTAGPTAHAQNTAVPFARTSSFGPNGTHYPIDLTWLGGEAVVELEADCSWEAITYVVSTLTAEQVAAGAAVRVKPGRLIGRGNGSSRNPVLADLGDPSWTRNVLICPRDGYGSVTVEEAGIRLDKCHRLSLFGFTGPDVGIVLTECSDLHLGWGQWTSLGITRGGARIELYELVLGFRRDPDDTFGIRPTDSLEMTDISRHGCAFGPSVKPEGSSAHCDTAQLEGTGNGVFGPFLSYDCVDFGSSNAALLLHTAVTRAEFHHSLILGSTLPWEIYPLQAGDYPGEPNAFSGGALDVRLYDSKVVGAIGRLGYTHVVNSALSYEPADRQRASVEGDWTVDESMNLWNASDIMSMTGTDYSPASLAAIWSW